MNRTVREKNMQEILEHWQPSAALATIQKRADLIKKIRLFFEKKSVLEVETPLLSPYTITEPQIESITASVNRHTYYLQTSPEFHMKRLLAAGYPSIYQISKAFRDNESGAKHHTEFTLLEWYRLGFEQHALMQEIDEFLQFVLQAPAARFISYQDIFQEKLSINPHMITAEALRDLLLKQGLTEVSGINPLDKDICLQRLMDAVIEPYLASLGIPVFIFDFPATQAALAKLHCVEDQMVAARFELYWAGMELANGFHELQDPVLQAARFVADQKKRQQAQLVVPEIDGRFLAALSEGLPDCAGVAMGIDRLLMLALKQEHINKVVTFLE